MNANDIEQLLQDIPIQPPVVVPVRTVQEAVAAGDMTSEMLENVWVRLRDRLSSLDSSTSLLQVTSEYAAHFYDMYVEGHTGKHLTGDRIRILLLNLPFVFRELIAPEVKFP